MVILDATITLVALPSIQSDLHFAPSDLQWVINAYMLAFGGFLLLGGRAGDLLGRRRLFLAGVGLFTVASALDAAATSPAFLIGARALQGLGAALVSPAALSIITTTVPEGPDRAKALGAFAAISGAGGAAGLLLGGAADRRSVLAVGVPRQPARRRRPRWRSRCASCPSRGSRTAAAGSTSPARRSSPPA